MRFENCPVGMFLHGSTLALKTKYGLDAYIVSSGEQFCGGANDSEELRSIEVTPVEIEPVRHGKWLDRVTGMFEMGKCSCCGKNSAGAMVGKYCTNCGAKMDLEERTE